MLISYNQSRAVPKKFIMQDTKKPFKFKNPKLDNKILDKFLKVCQNTYGYFDPGFASEEQMIEERGQPDLITYSGTCYWLDEEGLIRVSNHWGYVARNSWQLEENNFFRKKVYESREIGKINWSDLMPIYIDLPAEDIEEDKVYYFNQFRKFEFSSLENRDGMVYIKNHPNHNNLQPGIRILNRMLWNLFPSNITVEDEYHLRFAEGKGSLSRDQWGHVIDVM